MRRIIHALIQQEMLVKCWFVGSTLALAAFVTLVLAPAPGEAQTPGPTYTPPRTREGQPDLQGIWQVLNTAAWDLQDHSASLGVPAGRGVVEGNEIPYRPDALAKKQENFKNRQQLDPEHQCILPGVPRITYLPYPFRIVQQADKVTILHEYSRIIRYIYMNGNPHPEGPIDWFMGDSRGRWEGNSLVVDVIHFNDATWFDRAGNYHSDALHLVERFTPTGADHLMYEVTIEDPKVFTRPWKISMPLYRRQEKDIELLEYECGAYLLK
ncbi:MAG TPA: hypothetical protein VGJ78_17925, partial [Vicinamibacterales bacterium]